MFAWLNGPGENFRHPLPNSTNYLSAYDRRGNLLRGTIQKIQDPSGPETADSRALEGAATEQQLERESRDDLKPFPLNQQFVSQSILSEALRLEIWKRVQVQKKSVRQVSVELGVEMRRVGAVVRLVEVERRMKAEVREGFFLHSQSRRALSSDEQQFDWSFRLPRGASKNKLQLSEDVVNIVVSNRFHPALG